MDKLSPSSLSEESLRNISVTSQRDSVCINGGGERHSVKGGHIFKASFVVLLDKPIGARLLIVAKQKAIGYNPDNILSYC